MTLAFFFAGSHIFFRTGKKEWKGLEEPRTEDMLALMARLQRLRRLTQSAGEGKEVPQETPLPFAEEKGERILMTAIPFLDWAYQKDL